MFQNCKDQWTGVSFSTESLDREKGQARQKAAGLDVSYHLTHLTIDFTNYIIRSSSQWFVSINGQ